MLVFRKVLCTYLMDGPQSINQSINQYFFIKMYLRETVGYKSHMAICGALRDLVPFV